MIKKLKSWVAYFQVLKLEHASKPWLLQAEFRQFKIGSFADIRKSLPFSPLTLDVVDFSDRDRIGTGCSGSEIFEDWLE